MSYSPPDQPLHYIGPTNPACDHLYVFRRAAPEDTNYEMRGFTSPTNKPDFRPGDLVIYFRNNGVFGDLQWLAWTRVISISSTIDTSGSVSPQITATSADGLQAYNKIVVYRLDDSGTIVDVTNGLFVFMSELHLRHGAMRPGHYWTDGDYMRDVRRKGQHALNDKCAASSELRNVQVPIDDPSVTIQDTVLRDVMARVQRQHYLKIRDSRRLFPSPRHSPFFQPQPSTPLQRWSSTDVVVRTQPSSPKVCLLSLLIPAEWQNTQRLVLTKSTPFHCFSVLPSHHSRAAVLPT